MPTHDVEHPPKGAKLDLYVSYDCPYSLRAIAYYDHEAIPYEVHDAQTDLAERKAMFALANNDPTVPAIVINGEYVQSGWGKPPRG